MILCIFVMCNYGKLIIQLKRVQAYESASIKRDACIITQQERLCLCDEVKFTSLREKIRLSNRNPRRCFTTSGQSKNEKSDKTHVE